MTDHSQKAMALFREGYNCAQSVFGAFCDLTQLQLDDAVRLASSFGGGMGRLREVCGALTGAFMAAGALYGYDDPKDDAAKKKHYALIQEMARRFKEESGSIICRDLLALQEGASDPAPDKRTAQYYAGRPCEALVGVAAGILDEHIQGIQEVTI